ncbi:MAG: polysaccharide biosynthesis protein [Oscillospiraceae bacterium]|nr:polysaccharide biosynthesis protein [Oscillospiraceae bacterium]
MKKEPGEAWKLRNRISRALRLKHWQLVTAFLILYDVVAVSLSFFLALWLRFDLTFSAIPDYYLNACTRFSPIYALICIAVFWLLRLYRSIWRFASFKELERILLACLITVPLHAILIRLLFTRMPISYFVFGTILQAAALIAVRFSYRFVLLLRASRHKNAGSGKRRVMLIGAGEAGQLILRDIARSEESRDEVCCIIDDNKNKWDRFVEGVRVVGGREDILAQVDKYKIDKIYMAIPSASAADKRDILNICKETDCELKILPGVQQLVNSDITVGAMKNVAIEDLLGREPIRTDMEDVLQFVRGKCVLVTGGGGSIGSEICRQVASHGPSRLIIFDIYENNAYDIQLELRDRYPKLDLLVLIGSVRDSRRLDQIFSLYHPDLVYHAAAHKHVPLMEDSPCESIKNNVIGTYKTAYAAMVHGCSRFVLISTDKAVNPTNIMGASKRLCEMVVQTFDRKIRDGRACDIPSLYTHWEGEGEELRRLPGEVHTEYVAVRFGNVLGSNGSVVPLFKKQIERGGPVTVTHPDVIRYFMTVPEAVSLVLQAGVYARGGEIFVLDMGSPVKIDTLARNLIKLSGFKPDVDIPIEYTGLRPGEKLYEEKLMAEEGLEKTKNKLIHIGHPVAFDNDRFLRQISVLMDAAYANRDDIRELVMSMVSTYHPAGRHGQEKKDETYDRLAVDAETVKS